MKKSAGVFGVILAVLFLYAPVLKADETPPAIEKGWNLISTPCDVSLSELKQNLGNDAIEVFDWNGREYVQVQSMERGRGYLLNSNAVLNTSVVCKQDDPLPPRYTKTFRQGWNLIGNPLHRSVVFKDVLGGAASSFTLIYEYQGNKLRPVDMTGQMKPFRGYWIYAGKETAVAFTDPVAQAGCDSIVLLPVQKAEAAKTGGSAQPAPPIPGFPADIYVGDPVPVAAWCVTGVVLTDVSANADWTITPAELLTPTDTKGTYTAAKAGDVIITATLGKTAGSASLTIKDKAAVKLVKIELTADKGTLDIGEKVYLQLVGTYSDGKTAKLTTDAAYSNSNEKAGKLNQEFTCTDPAVPPICSPAYLNGVEIFTGLAAGQSDVAATYGGVASNKITFTVKAPDALKQLLLKTDNTTLEPYMTALLTVTGVYESGKQENLTKSVTWKVQPAGMAYIEQSTGRLSPSQIGNFSVTASYGGVTGNKLDFVVKEKTLRWLGLDPDGALYKLPCPTNPSPEWCYTHFAMKQGSRGQLWPYGESNLGKGYWIDANDTTWEVSDTSILTVDSNGYVHPVSEGLGGVRVYKDGVYSEWHWIYVYTDNTKSFLALEYSNQETIVEKGKTIDIAATLYKYDPQEQWFTSSNVTAAAEWVLTNNNAGSISKGLFTGAAKGDTGVFARYDNLKSNSTTLRVWQASHLTYCDPANINNATWEDGLSVATVETDCKAYGTNQNVNVRFLAELDTETGRRTLDVCLDMYIYDSNQKLVRTFQDRNCSPEPLFRKAAGANYVPVYDYTASWDKLDDKGNKVPAGEYTAVARYYILYCPVLKVKFTVQ